MTQYIYHSISLIPTTAGFNRAAADVEEGWGGGEERLNCSYYIIFLFL